ncbi:MAG: hypothetical protein IJR93_15030 [Treponema sp.]|nr:hypothetical protein [Treponema sp.]
MYAFILLAIPCLLLFFLRSPLAKGSYWLAFSLGFFPALAWCIIDEFFVFSAYRAVPALGRTYAHILIKDIVLPAVLLCGPYFLISRRKPSDRAFALLVVLAAFYMAYLPYGVISGEERFSFFCALVKPVLICSHVILLAMCCTGLCRSVAAKRKPLAVLFALGMIVFPALPPLAESLWFLAYPASAWIGIGAVMLAAAVLLPIFICETGSKTLDKSI